MKDFEPLDIWEQVGLQPSSGSGLGTETETVALLKEFAGDGPALELGIGRGRIARPLAATGIRVDGIDFSPAMVDALRREPGGDRIAATVADMSDFALPQQNYRLIYCVFNSFNNVISQDGQVRVFENVARHLHDDGCFVLETEINLRFFDRLTNGQYVEAEGLQIDRVRLDIVRVDPATQLLYENHVAISKDGIDFGPFVHRYTWPSELDLMARLAGLRLKHRWGGWHHESFTATSPTVISVFARG
jgi:SAM-dependent methyltransferase